MPFYIAEARFRRDGVALVALSEQLASRLADRAGPMMRIVGSLPPTGGSCQLDLFNTVRTDTNLAMLVDGLDPYVDLWLAEKQSLPDETAPVCAVMLGKVLMRGADALVSLERIAEVHVYAVLDAEVSVLAPIEAPSHGRISRVWAAISAMDRM
ncbi:hypothetical protein [Burkholderia multivorans]|uniref:hypothetical protein n=1 Tax=Burkholderia multivorans TaxID=87883 RepID=UPI001C2451AB|nr:hypothetical protein [Burkholderia multivorans]MBU9480687.1 hypothetical protein [Burkholderia multivorans]